MVLQQGYVVACSGLEASGCCMETDCGKAGVTKGAARQGATAVGLVGDAADLDQEDGHAGPTLYCVRSQEDSDASPEGMMAGSE